VKAILASSFAISHGNDGRNEGRVPTRNSAKACWVTVRVSDQNPADAVQADRAADLVDEASPLEVAVAAAAHLPAARARAALCDLFLCNRATRGDHESEGAPEDPRLAGQSDLERRKGAAYLILQSPIRNPMTPKIADSNWCDTRSCVINLSMLGRRFVLLLKEGYFLVVPFPCRIYNTTSINLL
jgi:hypothetical protein